MMKWTGAEDSCYNALLPKLGHTDSKSMVRQKQRMGLKCGELEDLVVHSKLNAVLSLPVH